MSINKSKARKLAEFLRNITVDSKLTTEGVEDGKIITTGGDLDTRSEDTTSLVSAASVTSYVGTKLGDYVHGTHDINLTFTGDVTGQGTITDMSHTTFNLTLDAETLPAQTGYAGKFLTTDGTSASWAAVDTSNGDTAFGWGDHSTEGYATQTYVDTELSNLVDSSPSTLDTLNELAAALGDDPNFAATTANSIGLKAPKADPIFTGTVTTDRKLRVSDMSSLSQTRSGAMTILGHNALATDNANEVAATYTGYYSSFIKMYYSDGITFHGVENQVTAGDVVYVNGGTTNELMRLSLKGNLGIGNTNPDAYSGYTCLVIGNNGGQKSGLIKLSSIYNSGNGAEIYQATSGNLNFNINNSTTALELLTDKTMVLRRLMASGLAYNSYHTSKTTRGAIHLKPGNGTANGDAYQTGITFMGINEDESQGGIYFNNDQSNGTTMAFATTDSYAIGPQIAMTISSDGHVNLPRGEFRNNSIWVNDGSNAGSYNENIRLFDPSNNGPSVIAFGASGLSGEPRHSILSYDLAGYGLDFRVGSSRKLSIRSDGTYIENNDLIVSANLNVSGTITESSSIRYKENISTITGALDKVNNLRGVYYNKIDSPEQNEIGLIAEEVNDIIPELATIFDDQVEGVKYSKTVAVLVEAIKELTARVEELENGKS